MWTDAFLYAVVLLIVLPLGIAGARTLLRKKERPYPPGDVGRAATSVFLATFGLGMLALDMAQRLAMWIWDDPAKGFLLAMYGVLWVAMASLVLSFYSDRVFPGPESENWRPFPWALAFRWLALILILAWSVFALDYYVGI